MFFLQSRSNISRDNFALLSFGRAVKAKNMILAISLDVCHSPKPSADTHTATWCRGGASLPCLTASKCLVLCHGSKLSWARGRSDQERGACTVGSPDGTGQAATRHSSTKAGSLGEWTRRSLLDLYSEDDHVPAQARHRRGDHLAQHYPLCPCSCTERNQSFALTHVCKRGPPTIHHTSRKRKALTAFCMTCRSLPIFTDLYRRWYIWNTLPSQEVCLFCEHFKVRDLILVQACIWLFNVIPSIFAQNANHQAILYTFIFLLNIWWRRESTTSMLG